VPSRYRENLTKQAQALPLDTILAGLDVLNKAKEGLRRGHHGRALLEIALVRLGRLSDLVSLTQLSQWLSEAGRKGQESIPGKQLVPPGGAGAPRATFRPAPEKKNPDNKQAIAEAPAGALAGMNATAPSTNGLLVLSAESLPQVWREVLAQVGPMLAGSLEKAERIAISGPKTLVLHFPLRYNHLREHCQEPTRLDRVEEAVRKVTGQAWSIRVESGSNAAAPLQAPAAEVEPSQSRYRRQRTEAMQQPLVHRAFEVLGAQFVHLDEEFGAAHPAPEDRAEPLAAEEQ
jgi:hypothetical protein